MRVVQTQLTPVDEKLAGQSSVAKREKKALVLLVDTRFNATIQYQSQDIYGLVAISKSGYIWSTFFRGYMV